MFPRSLFPCGNVGLEVLKGRTTHPQHPGCLQPLSPNPVQEHRRASGVTESLAVPSASCPCPSPTWCRTDRDRASVQWLHATLSLDLALLSSVPCPTLQHLSQGLFQQLGRDSGCLQKELSHAQTGFPGSFSSVRRRGMATLFLCSADRIPFLLLFHLSLPSFPSSLLMY